MPPNKCFGDNTIFLDFWRIVLDLPNSPRISVSNYGHPFNFQIFKNSVSESNNTNGRSQKQVGEHKLHGFGPGINIVLKEELLLCHNCDLP